MKKLKNEAKYQRFIVSTQFLVPMEQGPGHRALAWHSTRRIIFIQPSTVTSMRGETYDSMLKRELATKKRLGTGSSCKQVSLRRR